MIGRTVLAAALAGTIAVTAGASTRMQELPPTARSDYIEYCAGCHGISGKSAPARLPELRDRVGYFLCTGEGRAYIARLPNVVRAPVTDRQALADLLNYMVFEIGGTSAPAGAKPYEAAELEGFVKNPLGRTSLVKERVRVVEIMMQKCSNVPERMKSFM